MDRVHQLGRANSPYLLQHKDNPVDWRKWSDEAFPEAKRRDVPVLLSVGYASSHLCHESAQARETGHLCVDALNHWPIWITACPARSRLDTVSAPSRITFVYHSAAVSGVDTAARIASLAVLPIC
jgi:hypothetical protein